MVCNGYQYPTEPEAMAARQTAADYMGLPVQNGETLYWVDYNFAELNDPQFYYITFDESLLPILGEPTEFEVIQPNPFDEATNNL
jgi:hypothetical protein